MSKRWGASSDEMTTAEAITRGELELDYDTAGKVPLPPPPETEPMVMCGLRLPPSLYGRIKTRAEAQGKTWSELARQLLEVGVTEEDYARQVSLAALRRAIAHVAQQSSPPVRTTRGLHTGSGVTRSAYGTIGLRSQSSAMVVTW